jgi:photosystem II stability/assembly factor-like uncharacterized protein
MREMRIHLLWVAVSVVLTFVGISAFGDQAPPSQPYVWKSVQMVGGGFVDGIVFHPTERGLRYARTDIGGAYRWHDQQHIWIPILDWVPFKDTNLMGVESIAVDPADPNRVYLACGMYTNATSPNAAILRSDDRGNTFERTDVPFKMGGNEDGRGNGERLAVDPNDGRVIYFGSRLAGLWRSTDRAVTWSKVSSFPSVVEGPATRPATRPAAAGFGRRRFGFFVRSSGIVFEIFDPRTGSAGKPSGTIYAGVSLMNRPSIFRSTDAGQTWQPVPGEPTALRPSHGVLASNGVMYFSYGNAPGPTRMTSGAIWKYDTKSGQWTDITPEKPGSETGQFGYGAVAVDAANANTLIASTFGHPKGEQLFRSIDAGKTWKPIFGGSETNKNSAVGFFDYSGAPYVHHTPIHWLLDIEIDPCDPNHAMFTTGYGGWETFDLTNVDVNKPTHWSVMSKGIEETVALKLLSPAVGPHLISAIGDYGGFVHWDLDKPAADGNLNPRFGNTTGAAFAAKNPAIVVRVGGVAGGDSLRINLGYSTDGGKSWQPSKTMPTSGSQQGSVSVNADGTRWIWTPQNGAPYVTTDHGSTWKRCAGLPVGSRTIADSVNPSKFYAIDLPSGELFTSKDGGEKFDMRPLNLPSQFPTTDEDRGDARGGQDQIYADPATEGGLWLASFDGLFHSTDSGQSFIQLPAPGKIHAFGFGKSAPDTDAPALYLVGTIAGERGVFRSDDGGKFWVRINDDAHQYGLLLQISGDPRIYGRVYLGTHGRGVLYGDPAK